MHSDNPPLLPLPITSHSVLRHNHTSYSRLSPLTSEYAGGCYSMAYLTLQPGYLIFSKVHAIYF